MQFSALAFAQTGGRTLSILSVAILCLFQGTKAYAQEFVCGDFKGGFGPYDYRTATVETKRLVESVHFTTDVEMLRHGSTGSLGADIGYTLNAFPNHPRALLAMSNLARRTNTPKPPGAKWTINCYFDRAIRYQPNDPYVRLVFAIHLTRTGQKDAARAQLDMAEKDVTEEGGLHYNLGLGFLEVGDTDRALAHAWRAYELGYDLPGLRSRLQKMGKWRDPPKTDPPEN